MNLLTVILFLWCVFHASATLAVSGG